MIRQAAVSTPFAIKLQDALLDPPIPPEGEIVPSSGASSEIGKVAADDRLRTIWSLWKPIKSALIESLPNHALLKKEALRQRQQMLKLTKNLSELLKLYKDIDSTPFPGIARRLKVAEGVAMGYKKKYFDATERLKDRDEELRETHAQLTALKGEMETMERALEAEKKAHEATKAEQLRHYQRQLKIKLEEENAFSKTACQVILRRNLKALAEHKEREILRVKEENEKKLLAAREESNKELLAAKEEHEKQLLAAKEKHEKQLLAAKEDHRNVVLAVKEKHMEKILAINDKNKKRVLAAKEKHKKEILAVKKKLKREICALKEKYKETQIVKEGNQRALLHQAGMGEQAEEELRRSGSAGTKRSLLEPPKEVGRPSTSDGLGAVIPPKKPRNAPFAGGISRHSEVARGHLCDEDQDGQHLPKRGRKVANTGRMSSAPTAAWDPAMSDGGLVDQYAGLRNISPPKKDELIVATVHGVKAPQAKAEEKASSPSASEGDGEAPLMLDPRVERRRSSPPKEDVPDVPSTVQEVTSPRKKEEAPLEPGAERNLPRPKKRRFALSSNPRKVRYDEAWGDDEDSPFIDPDAEDRADLAKMGDKEYSAYLRRDLQQRLMEAARPAGAADAKRWNKLQRRRKR